MKNLANCKPREFMVQTSKIKKAVEKWLTVTDIMNIRKTMPELKEGMSKEERKKALEDQARKNLSIMFDTIFDKYPEETLDVLALCCFVEPENVDDYPVSEYLKAFTEIIDDEAVIGFFNSLMRLGQRGILTA